MATGLGIQIRLSLLYVLCAYCSAAYIGCGASWTLHQCGDAMGECLHFICLYRVWHELDV
jgi:hypothetical protein